MKAAEPKIIMPLYPHKRTKQETQSEREKDARKPVLKYTIERTHYKNPDKKQTGATCENAISICDVLDELEKEMTRKHGWEIKERQLTKLTLTKPDTDDILIYEIKKH